MLGLSGLFLNVADNGALVITGEQMADADTELSSGFGFALRASHAWPVRL